MNSSVDSVLALVRPDILALTAYSSARKESKGGRVWLDANENPETPSAHQQLLNRYPEPQPSDLLAKLATLYGVSPTQALVTRGSDEGIDLLLRTFCRAGQDAILITPPTYGMYVVAAGIQGASVVKVPLVQAKNFALDAEAVIAAALANAAVKLVFLCTPNNPTGNLLNRADVLKVTRALAGRAVVVADEAYVDFSGQPSLASEIGANPNLVVLRTLSKAFGLAGARVGTTIADPAVIAVLQKVIAPYPIPAPVVQAALAALSADGLAAASASVALLISERVRLAAALPKLAAVKELWPSDTNYLLLEVADAAKTMAAGRAAGVIWRDRQKDVPNTIRITVGSPDENNATLEVLARV
ncbi:histidinol-phosphate transaminase [Oleiharenicola lentus]|uniref:histidinol-phosphate transaminase n=1 Tax=Oleiharenicola lentus TaxID=2508720 RepID=UPI003F668695